MKKGESALTFIFSVIFLAIILLIFYVLFSKSALNKTENIITQIDVGDVNINLVNYLRTPLKDKTTVKDLIINSYYNNDYKDLDKITSDIFNKVYDNERCPLWEITGDINNKKFFDYESGFDIRKYTLRPTFRNFFLIFSNKYLLVRKSSLDLLFPNPDIKAEITLTEGCIEVYK